MSRVSQLALCTVSWYSWGFVLRRSEGVPQKSISSRSWNETLLLAGSRKSIIKTPSSESKSAILDSSEFPKNPSNLLPRLIPAQPLLSPNEAPSNSNWQAFTMKNPFLAHQSRGKTSSHYPKRLGQTPLSRRPSIASYMSSQTLPSGRGLSL